jgi:quinol monooxygenase YgiN
MIVVYGSFEIPARSRAAFDSWMTDLIERRQGEAGQISYEYFINSRVPQRGYVIEVWENIEAVQAIRGTPPHAEFLERASRDFGARDFQTHFWSEAEGYRLSQFESTDDL